MTTTSNPGKGDAESRILDSAAKLFANFGYNGVSTRDIAAKAEVNEVTIYRHYPRKRIAEAADGRTVLARTFELIATTLIERPDLLRLVQYSTLELGEDIDPMLRKHLGELVEVVAHYLQPWVERGALRASNAKALILALIALVLSHRPLRRIFAGEVISPEVLFEAYAEFCVS